MGQGIRGQTVIPGQRERWDSRGIWSLLQRRLRLDRAVTSHSSRMAGTGFVLARHKPRTQDRKGKARAKVKDKVRLRKQGQLCLRHIAPQIKN